MIDAGQLYANHARQIGGFLTNRWDGPPDDIDDLVAEVFARAVQAAPRYEDQGWPSPKPWLFKIANNLLIDTIRAAPYRTHLPLEPSYDRVDLSAPRDLDAVLDRMVLYPALAKLTAEQRRVIECRFLLDLSEQQTAEATGRTYAAVKKLQARALLQLRWHLRVQGVS